VNIVEFDTGGYERLPLSFSGLPRWVGTVKTFHHQDLHGVCDTQPLPNIKLYITECDVMVGNYKTDSIRQSEVTIRSFDAVSGEVSGSFKLHFVAIRKPEPWIIKDAKDRCYYEAEFKVKLWQKGQNSYL
jgi:hypothetical protein